MNKKKYASVYSPGHVQENNTSGQLQSSIDLSTPLLSLGTGYTFAQSKTSTSISLDSSVLLCVNFYTVQCFNEYLSIVQENECNSTKYRITMSKLYTVHDNFKYMSASWRTICGVQARTVLSVGMRSSLIAREQEY
jgi:hypothetical protein